MKQNTTESPNGEKLELRDKQLDRAKGGFIYAGTMNGTVKEPEPKSVTSYQLGGY